MKDQNETTNSETAPESGGSTGATLLSDGRLGWAIRTIDSVNGDTVTLEDGVSFASPCFAGAVPGDIWAVRHEPGGACFGMVRQAILLQPAGR